MVAPHLRTGIVGCSCLRVTQSLLDDLGDVKITQFSLHVLEQEQIRTLHITVQYAALVERLESSNDLNEDIPDLLLFDISLSLLIVADLLEHITVVSILHYEAKARS